MEKRSEFLIPFASLPIGEHRFDYQINDKFFAAYEHPLLTKAMVNVQVLFVKTTTSMQLNFELAGTVRLQCGRCLEDFDRKVNANEHLVIRVVSGEHEEESDDEHIVNVPDREHALDLAPHIYDYLSLQVPLNPVHAEDSNGIPECDPKIMEIINRVSVNEIKSEMDPRWDSLRNIKLN